MNIYEYDLLDRLANACNNRCWRVAKARIRDLARLRQELYDVPYTDTMHTLSALCLPDKVEKEIEKEIRLIQRK